MLSINFKKFSEFYHSNIEPQLIDLERERKKCVIGFTLTDIIFYMSIIIGICLSFFIFILWKINILKDEIYFQIFPVVPFYIANLIVIIGAPIFLHFEKKKKQYIASLKTEVYKIIFNLIDMDYNQNVPQSFNNYQNAVLKYIPTKKLYSYVMKFEDGITSVFKDIPFELCDAKIAKRYENQYHNEQTIFQGLLLAVKINKSVKDETVIKSDNFNLFKIDKEIIKLEDNEFNKRFKVLADSEIEARYIITPSFMERLKNFHKRRKDKTIIFFDSKCSESMNMFILTNTGKDNFEIPFNKSILNEKYYYNLLKDLINMLEIAVALKLEQNIGL